MLYKPEFIHLPLYVDNRGIFRRTFCDDLIDLPLGMRVVQTNISQNPHKGTFRGFHFEESLSREWKFMSVVFGKIFIATICVDKERDDFKKIYTFEIDSEKGGGILIPPWFANAFLTLSENSVIAYSMTLRFEDGQYGVISRQEAVFEKIDWPCAVNVISVKDDKKTNYFDG